MIFNLKEYLMQMRKFWKKTISKIITKNYKDFEDQRGP